MRRTILVLGLLAAVAAGCGGGGDNGDRDAVRSYVDRMNAIQRSAQDRIAAANAAYAALSRRRLPGPAVALRARAAEDDLRALRARLAAVAPPPVARTLRRDLLRVYELDIALAGEAEQLARYTPAATRAMAGLPRAGRTLRRRLAAAAGDAQGQAAALRAYAHTLGRIEARMRRLDPPRVLLTRHRGQLLRLDQARALGRRLRAAVLRADARATARLLVRFSSVGGDPHLDLILQRDAVRAYQRRVRAVERAAGVARIELARLQKTLQ